jgi:hypothetical protein
MNRNKVIRGTVPIFVGVLLCILLMQTAFAGLYSPNLGATVGNPSVRNSPNLDAAAGNPSVWNLPYLDAVAENPPVWNLPDPNTATGEPVVLSTDTNKTKTITTMSGSIPPSDLMNILSPLQISYV